MEKEKPQVNKFIIALLILIILSGTVLYITNITSTQNFDSGLWRAQWDQFNVNINDVDYDASDAYALLSERDKMVKSLLKSKILLNLDKSAVIEILGLEDNDLDSNTWDYWIKHRGIGESTFLRIEFNTNNQVESVRRFNEE